MKNKFFESAYGLQNIKRFSNRPVVVHHSPAEHSYYVAVLALFIAESENLKIEKKEDKFDIAIVLKKSLCHDMPESLTGDLLYPIKHSSPELHKKVQEIEEAIVRDVLLKHLSKDLQENFYDSIIHCKDGREGQLVAFCDQLEVLYYLVEEKKLGNMNQWVEEVFNTVKMLCDALSKTTATSRKLYEHVVEEMDKISSKEK